jgi:hypothetical protein
MKRGYVDFAFIPEHQLPMHWRLVNWNRSLHGSAGTGVSPMFRQYRSSEVYSGGAGKLPVDEADATKIGKAVQQLSMHRMLAINWWYVKPNSPAKAALGMQCSIAELAQYVIDGRAALIDAGC